MTTTSKIRVLSDQTINQIAAGEVIENPASVVKELVENSLDAGATDICIEIQGGGRQLIRVSDNGCGMSSDDAILCLERHATSKIREVTDIQDLLTMGFRGEAIPSIASISKFSLLTCPQLGSKSLQGTLVLVDGGRLLSSSPAARSPGTTIEVKSLFFNVPVRRKFQRSPAYDTQEIIKMIHALALGYPFIQFELISDQKSVLKTLPAPTNSSFQQQLYARLEHLLGQEFASSLCPLHFQQEPYELKGYIGLPSMHKPNRKSQFLFINQRSVYSPLISTAIREGYGTMLGTQRYPVFVLHLTLPGSYLDVNVHPQKKEVRLRQEQMLKEALIQAVQQALRQKSSPSFVKEEKIEPSPSFFFKSKSPPPEPEDKWEFKANPTYIIPDFKSLESQLIVRETPVLSEEEQPLFASLPSKVSPRICLTLPGYLVLDRSPLDAKQTDGLCLMDQRAAYARLHYERLLKRADGSQVGVQTLLIPLTLSFSAAEAACLKEHVETLNQLGFSIREFGDKTFVLDAYPALLAKKDIEACLGDMIHDLMDLQGTRQLQIKKEEKLAWAACRASLPPTKRLSIEEAQGLLDQVLACTMPFQCPLGRPIFAYLSQDDLAKLFV